MFRIFFALLWGIAITGCASLWRTEGVHGPVAWHVTDLKVQAVGEPTRFGQLSVTVKQKEVYSFTIVLRETRGIPITITKIDSTLYASGAHPWSREQTGRWELTSQKELRWPFSYSYACASTVCNDPGAIAPTGHMVFTGIDNQGQPVRIVVDFRLPPDPTTLEKR